MKQLIVVFVVIIFLLPSVNAGTVSNDMKKILAKEPLENEIPAIVLFEKSPTSTEISSMPAKVKNTYKIIPAASVRLRAGNVPKLAGLPFVKSIEPDYAVKFVLDKSVPQIQADKVWINATGAGIDVAIIDTGIKKRNDLNVVKETDFTGEGADDLNGHGTHVAGIVASQDATYRGVAYGSNLFNVKVLRSDGSGFASDVIAGIDWAVSNGAEIISMSLGAQVSACDGTDALSQAADSAVAKGIVVVVAAGNSGPGNGTINSPGCAKAPITIGAVDDSDSVPSFSSRGPAADGRTKPDIVAPGVAIRSTWLSGFKDLSGTSMSTPHASGSAAVLLEKNQLQPSEIKSILMSSAKDLGLDANTQGSGRLDAKAAFDMLAQSTPALSITINAPSKIVADSAFQIKATIKNTGEAAAANTTTELSLPPGLSTSEVQKQAGDIASGSSSEVLWDVLAELPGDYTITLKASSGEISAQASAKISVVKQRKIPPGLQKKNLTSSAVPGSLLYGLMRVFENLELALTPAEQRVEKLLQLAERRLVEAQQNKELATGLLSEYQQLLVEARESAKMPSDNENIFVEIETHSLALEEIKQKQPEKGNFVEAVRQVALEAQKRSLEQLSQQLPERASEIAEAIAEKRLEEVNEKVPEQAKPAMEKQVEKISQHKEEPAKERQPELPAPAQTELPARPLSPDEPISKQASIITEPVVPLISETSEPSAPSTPASGPPAEPPGKNEPTTKGRQSPQGKDKD